MCSNIIGLGKTFDKVNQKRMVKTLSPVGIPSKLCNIIDCLYKDPKFKVHDQHSSSIIKRQCEGIRQGCPLSPYLFVILLSVIFGDIHQKNPKLQNGSIDIVDFTELLYADDTLLVMKQSRQVNNLLWELEKESEYYNLALNKDECVVLEMGGSYNIRFQDGHKLQHVDETKYLGGVLASDARRDSEIIKRIGDTMSVFRKPHIFLH